MADETEANEERAHDEQLRSSLENAHLALDQLRGAPPSRLGVLGRLPKRIVRRLLRFAFAPQLEFGVHTLDALSRLDARLDALSRLDAHLDAQAGEHTRQLAAIPTQLDALERTIGRLGASIDPLTERVAKIEAELRSVLDPVREHLSALEDAIRGSNQSTAENRASVAAAHDELRSYTARVSAIELHLPKLMQDVHADFAELRAVQNATGRQVDEVGGELVSNTMDIRELGKKVRRFGAEQDRDAERIRTLEKRFEPLTDLDHFDFAKVYRGDPGALVEKLEAYAVQFGPVQRVLDFGCGRGEFIRVCRDNDIGAYGVDLDPDMISHCKLQELDVIEGNALEHLRGLPSRSLDGIFSAQVVEHLTPVEIVEMIQLASEKLKRGGKIVLETINPATWSAMRWFYLDPSHCQPVPVEMLRFFLEQAKFEVLDVVYSSPVPDKDRLQPIEVAGKLQDPAVEQLIKPLNHNLQRLNDLLCGAQDYAIIAER